jgi:hypothetical protein
MRLVWLGLAVLAAYSTVCSQQTNRAAGKDYEVTATKVMRFNDAAQHPVNFVEYTYSFPGLATVYLDGIGMVPGSGSFSYFTYAKGLEFRSSKEGQPLASVVFAATDQQQSDTPIVQAPEDKDFPASEGALTGRWESPDSIAKVGQTIVEEITSARLVRTANDTERFLTTTYIPLRSLPAGLIGKVSIRVAYPDNPPPGGFDFRIQRVIREGRSKTTALRETGNGAILDAGEAVFREVAARLRARGGKAGQ